MTVIAVMGTPVYFGAMSGEMRSFLERLLFAPLVYSMPPRSLFPRRIRTGMIYTMNATGEMSAELRYNVMFKTAEASLGMVFGQAETLCCHDTLQFPDYSKVVMEYMDPAEKEKRRREVFPEDCRRAFDLGSRIASKTQGDKAHPAIN